MDCIFCKIVNGEIPSYTVFENDDFKVMLDAFPSGTGHTLVVPKKHFANIFDIDEQTVGELYKLVKRTADALKQEVEFDGLNILQNNGEAAGQTVHHFHVHLIPRKQADDVKIGWTPLGVDKEKAPELAAAIGKRL